MIYANGLLGLVWLTVALYTIRWMVPASAPMWTRELLSSWVLTVILLLGLIQALILWYALKDPMSSWDEPKVHGGAATEDPEYQSP